MVIVNIAGGDLEDEQRPLGGPAPDEVVNQDRGGARGDQADREPDADAGQRAGDERKKNDEAAEALQEIAQQRVGRRARRDSVRAMNSPAPTAKWAIRTWTVAISAMTRPPRSAARPSEDKTRFPPPYAGLDLKYIFVLVLVLSRKWDL